MSVSQLAARIDGALRTIPSGVKVAGEVSGFRDRTHWYFDLKDADAVINCVMFASAARRAGFVPQAGQEVIAKGRVEFYAKGGKVSLLVDSLKPVGEGALDAAFRKLCDDLRARGWFDVARKRPLPAFPRRVAIVTSATGAALQDVLVTMRRRCPAVEILTVDVRVQGDGAAAEVAAAIDALGARAAAWGVDAILVTRGGGSKEDLWAFNELPVAQAIVRCPVPVVAAIGHETDTTIAELVADERCATPTQAAMRLTPDRAALHRQLFAEAARVAVATQRCVREHEHELARASLHLSRGFEREIAAAHDRLARVRGRLDRVHPGAIHARNVAAVRGLAARLRSTMESRLVAADPAALAARLSRATGLVVPAARTRLVALERQLGAVSPLRVLERGYSLTMTADGAIARDASSLQPGDELRTRLATGEVRSIVKAGGDHGNAPRDAVPLAAKPRVRVQLAPHVAPKSREGQAGREGGEQPSLF
ncbi:MAG: exodeoxyribonuclease VII large subunit [Planctomycetota bacterium]|nr:exodeoxyribonuclease VII large subunit [Planctomycetota bacterium]